MATLAVLCVVVVGLRVFNDALNRRNLKILGEMGMEEAGEEERQRRRDEMAFRDETDRRNVFFVYTH